MNKLPASWKRFIPDPVVNCLRRIRAKAQTAMNHYVLQREVTGRPAWRDFFSALNVFIRPSKTVLFFPERPPRRFAAYDHCIFLGYTISKDPSVRFDAAVLRKNLTFADAAVFDPVPVSFSKVINAGCLDISKHRVDRVFAEVFGYALAVDPLQYTGPMVEKSDVNGSHDGRMVQGPMTEKEIRHGSVYQKAIDSQSERPGFFVDYRVPVHDGRIPLVYLKHRPVKNRFKEFDHTESRCPDEVFSLDEQNQLCRMARAMGLDCGDLDVLRDSDGRIYVVDVNNTPMTHIEDLPPERRRAVLAIMADSFDRMIKTRICSGRTASS